MRQLGLLFALFLSVLLVVGTNARHSIDKKQIKTGEPQNQETAFQDLLAAIDRSEITLKQVQLMQAQLAQAQLMQAQHIEQQTELLNKVDNLTLILNAILLSQRQGEEKAKNVSCDSKLNASSFLDNPRLLRTIPVGEDIYGLTVLDSQLFVVPGSTQVNVYDTNNFTPTRNITITDSSYLGTIVASPGSNCLYISDLARQVIFRYNLTDNVISRWSVDGDCSGLSLTSTHNVLVTLYSTKQIKEYTPDGSLVREISLDRSIGGPVHSVQLSSGQFVVSHGGGDTLHRVCIVDTSGRIIQCYGETSGSDVGQLNHPSRLAVDRYGNVLVADTKNNRVVLLSPSLTHLGYITIPGHTLSRPQALHLDLLTSRLYIGEITGTGRVFVLTV